MLVIPAIDLRGGKCVRLVQGDYGRETVFGDDPVEMALRWAGEGAERIHLVDLDGARSRGDNQSSIRSLVSALGSLPAPGVETQLGGGIRTVEAAGAWLEAGVDRVILGTVAAERPRVLKEAAGAWPGRVWAGIDARGGRVALEGWTRESALEAVELARRCQELGAAGVVYTDIERDGTGAGVNLEQTSRLAAAISIPVLASGGVASIADVLALKGLAGGAIEGVVVGRALYDGSLNLEELIVAAG